MITLTPKVTCVVVDVSGDEPDVEFKWFVNNVEVYTAQTEPPKELSNGTLRVVSVLPIQHNDWLSGKKFKCKVNNKGLPGPTERTISKPQGGICRQTGWELWWGMRMNTCVDSPLLRP